MAVTIKPCRHLDHDSSRYPSCELLDCAPHFPDVKYWNRKDPDGNPQKVQFCKRIGRVPGIFQCYQQGEMHCYCPSGEQEECQ